MKDYFEINVDDVDKSGYKSLSSIPFLMKKEKRSKNMIKSSKKSLMKD